MSGAPEEEEEFGFGSEDEFDGNCDFSVDEADLASLDEGVSTEKIKPEGPVCRICRHEMREGDITYTLKDCNHTFHRFCLLRNIDSQLRSTARLVCPIEDCGVELCLGDSETLRKQADSVHQGTAFVDEAKDRIDAKAAQARGEVFVSSATRAATQRLTEELRLMSGPEAEKQGIRAELIDGNMFRWRVLLFGFDKNDKDERNLASDLERRGLKAIEMEIKFPEDFPSSPPFCRIVRPKFAFMTGHITLGGSICFELLTRTGWSSTNRVESVVISIRANLIEGGARLDLNDRSDYSEAVAREAYLRLCQKHGWQP